MNLLESCSMVDPFEVSSECGKFIIDDTTNPFVLHDITSPDREYTLGLYIKSDANGSISINGHAYTTSTEWTRIVLTFTAAQVNLYFNFTTAGTYYIFHPKLEMGNKATDWTPSPKDLATNDDLDDLQTNIDETNERVTEAEAIIQLINNRIEMLVRDENGETMMTQDGDDWYFSMADNHEDMSKLSESLDELQKATGSTAATVEVLQKAVDGLETTAAYVRIGEWEAEENLILPCIELGALESPYKLLVTNESILFINGKDVPTYVNSTGLVTQNITIKGDGELRLGGWVWKQRANLNFALQWAGV